MHHTDPDFVDDLEPEEIEAYCVSCRQKVFIRNPVPVWTRRGAPGTRGTCEICGGIVFRMGRTDAHRSTARPDTGYISDISSVSSKRRGRPMRDTAFLSFNSSDTSLAARLAEDLNRTGIPSFFDPGSTAQEVPWAGGVNPALDECSHMVLVLSGNALDDEQVQQDWAFFREQRKPVIVALAEPCEVPDALRRSPRIDFSDDYKTAFRQLVRTLAG